MVLFQQYKNKTIFLIDPNPDHQELFSKALHNTGILLIKYTSGNEALERIINVVPNLIFSAYQTDDWTGNQIFQEYNNSIENEIIPPVPFVFFTEPDELNEERTHLFDLGIRSWYTYPFGVHELRSVICNLLIESEVIEKNRELEQAIKRSEYRYRDLLESASDFIFTLDDMGNFVYLNNRFHPLTGYDKEDWLGKPFHSLMDQSHQKKALEHYEKVHVGKTRVFETDIIDAYSQHRILSINITPIVERGKVVGTMGIARDVTEQKAMEKEIIGLKNFNESIVQSIESGLLTIDLKRKITFINQCGESILGVKQKDLIGQLIDNIFQADELKELLKPTSGQRETPREMCLTLRSGKEITVNYTVTDRTEQDRQKVGTIITFQDISQLKQMQSEIIRMDRLASLGVLASGIAHEIKNPLAGIKTLAQACDEELESEDPRKEYLSRIVRQVNRLDKLLKTFFEYARPRPPVRKKYSIETILREVTSLVEKRMLTDNVNYNNNFHKDLPLIYVDSHQIQQVFLNLILNALDAMPEGGELHIQAQQMENNHPFVEMLISDSGIGIPANKLETIFDPFYTTKSTGLGLGLSIVYRIIQEHQGAIKVSSNLNKGTIFTMTLPLGDHI